MSLPLSGQNILVKGTVTDEESKKAIPNVSVTSSPLDFYATTDSTGAFEMVIDEKTSFLVFNILGYEKKTYSIPSIILANPLVVQIKLKKREVLLPSVTVFADVVAPVIKNKNFYVRDYDVLEDGKILALVYELNKKGGQIILTDDAGKIFSKAFFPDEPEELFLDCYSNHHIVTDAGAYQIYIENDTAVNLLDKTDLKKFKELLVPCVGQSSEGLFFVKKYSKLTPLPVGQPKETTLSLSYIMVTNSGQRKYIYTAADEKMEALQKSESSFEDQKDKAGMYREGGHGRERDKMFTEMTLVKDVFAPLLVQKDTVMIFDFANSKISFYSAAGSYVRSHNMDFERDRSWKRQLIFDKPQGKFYTVFDNGGVFSVHQIDPNSGKIAQHVKLELPFTNKIKIVNGVIYFIRSDVEWDGTKYLYRQRLD